MGPEKQCFKCGMFKSLEEYYKHPAMSDGYLGKCKECTKQDVRERRMVNHQYYVEYDRARYREDEERRYRLRAAEKRKREEFPEVVREQIKRCQQGQRQKFPEKYQARTAVHNAVRDGKLVRQPCRDCGNPKSEAHHPDYSRPLDVIWLCRRCHLREEGRLVA